MIAHFAYHNFLNTSMLRGRVLTGFKGIVCNITYYVSIINKKCNPLLTQHSFRKMSRYSASSIVPSSDSFSLSEYDCVGFDLDNTLCHYNVSNMVLLEYDILSRFLVREKGYNPKYLSKPLTENLDFLQKGLVLSCKNGNVLRVGADGYIHKAYHGTRTLLTQSEIVKYYGPDRQWNIAREFNKDMLIAWNGPLSYEIRTILDYFDLPASLCFARCVDTLDDNNGGPLASYDIWPDILAGMMYMFNRENFEAETGEYFAELKANPEKYYRQSSKHVISWVRSLREQNKLTYLITGSNVDYANLTAEHCIGNDWKELFDIIIYYARKPGFFIGNRPFLNIKGLHESGEVASDDLQSGSVYSQGNWKALNNYFKKSTGKANPKVVYFGDNIIQDIFTPMAHKKCDTIAIVEEMLAEGMLNMQCEHPDSEYLTSKMWGSFFCIGDPLDPYVPSMWDSIIRRHAKLCIPSLEYVANLPISHSYKAFNNEEQTNTGYFPVTPNNVDM